jgi:Zn-dependent protease
MEQDLIIFSVIVLIFSVIIHEVAHGWAAHALGDPTAKLANRLTLNPLRHIDPIGTILVPFILKLSGSPFLFGWAKPVPYNPYNLRNHRWGEAIVAIAGVATNIFLALLFGVIARYAYSTGAVSFGDMAAVIVFVNLILGIFNLIPVPPFDGYTFLRSILPLKTAMSFREFEERIARGGFLTLIVFILVFMYFLAKPFSALVFWIFRLIVGV